MLRLIVKFIFQIFLKLLLLTNSSILLFYINTLIFSYLHCASLRIVKYCLQLLTLGSDSHVTTAGQSSRRPGAGLPLQPVPCSITNCSLPAQEPSPSQPSCPQTTSNASVHSAGKVIILVGKFHYKKSFYVYLLTRPGPCPGM